MIVIDSLTASHQPGNVFVLTEFRKKQSFDVEHTGGTRRRGDMQTDKTQKDSDVLYKSSEKEDIGNIEQADREIDIKTSHKRSQAAQCCYYHAEYLT